MSVKVNFETGRKKDMEKMLKAIAEFFGNCPNARVSVQLEIKVLE